MNKITLYTIIYALIITIAVITLFNMNQSKKQEINRLSNNQTSYLTEIEDFKTKSGGDAIKIGELTLTANEFKKLCNEQVKEINDLNIKVKRLEGISTTGTATTVETTTHLKDSIIYHYVNDTTYIEKVKYFKWNDNWNNISGTIKNDSINCIYNGVDTLTIASERIPKKFLFFRWGTKRIDIKIKNANPSSKITYNKTINIK